METRWICPPPPLLRDEKSMVKGADPGAESSWHVLGVDPGENLRTVHVWVDPYGLRTRRADNGGSPPPCIPERRKIQWVTAVHPQDCDPIPHTLKIPFSSMLLVEVLKALTVAPTSSPITLPLLAMSEWQGVLDPVSPLHICFHPIWTSRRNF